MIDAGGVVAGGVEVLAELVAAGADVGPAVPEQAVTKTTASIKSERFTVR